MIDQQAALKAARSASEQSTYTALNAENILLRDELARIHGTADYDPGRDRALNAFATIERLTAERLALQVANEVLQLKFEASQSALDHALNGHRPTESTETLDLWWDALVRGDGMDRDGNHYSLPGLGYLLAKELRAQLAQVTAERERARDLCVRSGVFTRKHDDEHVHADRSPWED